jgi:hypothetical protein
MSEFGYPNSILKNMGHKITRVIGQKHKRERFNLSSEVFELIIVSIIMNLEFVADVIEGQ